MLDNTTDTTAANDIGISFDNPENTGPEISLGGASNGYPLPPAVLEQRATKAGVASNNNPQDIAKLFSTPEGEQMFRDQMSQQKQLDHTQQQLDLLNKMSASGTPMTNEKAATIMELTKNAQGPFDPNAVEDYYSKQAMKLAYANASSKTYADGMNQEPDKVNVSQDVGEGIIRTREFVQKLREDNSKWDTSDGAPSMFRQADDYATAFAKGMIPFYSTYQQFDKNADGWMPGANMEDQMSRLWMLDAPDREAMIKTKYETMKAENPIEANSWLDAILSYNSMDSVMANIGVAADLASVVPVGAAAKFIKGAGKVAEGVTAASKTTEEVIKTWTAADKAGQAATDLKPNDLRNQFLNNSGWSSTERPSDADQAVKGIYDTTRTLSSPKLDSVNLLANVGKTDEATKLGVMKEIESKVAPTEDSDLKSLQSKLLGVYNPVTFLKDSQNLTREQQARILQNLAGADDKFNKVLNNPIQVSRLNQEALDYGYQQAQDKLKDQFNQASDYVTDIKYETQTQYQNSAQLNRVVVTLGTNTGGSFNDWDHAHQVAEHLLRLPSDTYTIKQEGAATYIRVAQAVDESDPYLTKFLMNTKAQTPQSFANTVLGRIRSPEDLLSKTQRDARALATPMTQETQSLINSGISPSLQKLTKSQMDRLQTMMKINRDTQDGVERGKWFGSSADFESEYNSTFKHYPTPEETEAYMATRSLSDFDWTARSLGILKDKSMQGLQKITVRLPERNSIAGQTAKDLTAGDARSQFLDASKPNANGMTEHSFDGKEIDSLPKTSRGYDPGVFVIHDPNDASKVSKWDRLSKIDRSEIEGLQKDKNYKVYQSSSNKNLPFKDATGLPLQDRSQGSFYYVIQHAEKSNLRAVEQLPYKPGYHVEYPPGFYTKSPMFNIAKDGVKEYAGDRAIMYHTSEAQAKLYEGNLNKARDLFRENKTAELQDHLNKNLPHTYDEFTDIYKDGALKTDTPFFYTKSGQSVKDASRAQNGEFSSVFKGVADAGESDHNLSQFIESKFAQEKNIALPTGVEGSEGKPVFKFTPSQNISPLSTMNRAVHDITRMRVLDNYVKQGVSHMIEEFANPESIGGSVTKRSIDSVRNNPISFLTDPKWDESVLNKEKLAAAKNSYRALQSTLANSSDVSRSLDWLNNKILNFTFNKFGDTAVEKVADFLHTKLTDPTKYARSIAFHSKLGLFNPMQLLIHGQTLFHAIALTGNPARSWKAGAASSLMRYLSLTDHPEIINSFAKKAEFFGWDQGQFKDMFNTMREAGVWNVEGDHASIDDMMTSKVWKGKASTFLDKGTVFFKEGTRFVRLNSFATSYLEWAEKNPGKTLFGNSQELGSVLTRYGDLHVNMTHNSTADFQKGIFSIPTQFATFQIHMTEQMLSKRITTPEKVRLFSMYSALYGLPVGITMGAPMFDWNADIYSAAKERGIDTNQGVPDLLMHGALNAAMEVATGKQTNISERYGPFTLSFVNNVLTGQKALPEILGGASLQESSDVLKSVFDFAAPAVTALFRATPESNTDYPVFADDLVDAFRNVSSVNNAVKFYTAANFNTFYAKHGVIQDKNVDTLDGALSGFLGVDPRRITEAYMDLQSLKDIKAYKLGKEKDIRANIDKAFQSYGDPDQMGKYLKAAKIDSIAAGYNERDWMKVFSSASKNANSSIVDSANQAWQRQFPKDLPVQMNSGDPSDGQ